MHFGLILPGKLVSSLLASEVEQVGAYTKKAVKTKQSQVIKRFTV